jgi:nucleoside-diphosphate-sugar epimerase
MHNILVTGAGGYIGSVLVPDLLAEGYHVVALDRYFFGRETLPEHPHLKIVESDTRAIQPYHLKGIDYVIDLAAMSNDPTGEFFVDATWQINHRARVRTALTARKMGVKRYLLPSSCSIYGNQTGLLNEDTVAAPLSHYAKANRSAELDTLSLSTKDFAVTVVRQATVFGFSQRMRFDLAINAMIHQAWEKGRISVMRDGTQFRPFIHVQDVSSAFRHLLHTPVNLIRGRVFNLGTAINNYRIKDLAQILANKLEAELGPITLEWYGDPDLRSYNIDFTRITNETGWCARQPVTDAIKEILTPLQSGALERTPKTITLDWYKKMALQKSFDLDTLNNDQTKTSFTNEGINSHSLFKQ